MVNLFGHAVFCDSPLLINCCKESLCRSRSWPFNYILYVYTPTRRLKISLVHHWKRSYRPCSGAKEAEYLFVCDGSRDEQALGSRWQAECRANLALCTGGQAAKGVTKSTDILSLPISSCF